MSSLRHSALRDTSKDTYDPDQAFQDTSPFPASRRERMSMYYRSGDFLGRLGKGAAAGALAGLAAGLVMNYFQQGWQKAEEAASDDPEKTAHAFEEGSNATVKAAEAVAKPVIGRGLKQKEKKVAGPAVHFAFSTAMGALYGALTEAVPLANAGFGTAFGTALFIGADEIALPVLGLGSPPQETPLSKHAYALVSHWVWGAATEAGRRGIMAGLERI
jgi:putative membrane protein